MSNLLLSVAMPSYNVERYLRLGLDSFDDPRIDGKVELLIVDDGSTDSTAAIATEYAHKNPRVFRLISKENGGHGSAVNAGIENAKGKYFRIVDGDDWVDTDALVELLEVLARADTDIVVDRRTEVDMVSGEATSLVFPGRLAQRCDLDFADICLDDEICDLFTIHGMSVCTSLLKREEIRLLEKTFYVDYEYVAKASLHAKSVLFVDLGVYQYLVGNPDQSVADDSYVKRWDDHERVVWEMLRFYSDEAGLLDENRRYYLQHKVDLLVNTHYNIALIFDKDRKRGVARAKEFRRALREKYPEFAARGEKRYKLASALHLLGVNSQARLDKLTGK